MPFPASSSISSRSATPIDDDSAIRTEDVPTLEDLYKDGKLNPQPTGSEDPPAVVHPVNADLLGKVSVIKGDITKFAVDVIVNAANGSLLGGGGVDGAIHSAAGPGLKKECRTLGGAETGETKFTDAHRLPSKRIAHTVGPIFSYDNRDNSERLLRRCYEGCLQLAVAEGHKTIAFCSISTGIYGYPIVAATHVALDTVRDFLASERGASLSRVIFVVFSQKDERVYHKLAPLYFPSHLGITSRDSFTDAADVSSSKPNSDPSEGDIGSELSDALAIDSSAPVSPALNVSGKAGNDVSMEERTFEGRDVVSEKVEGTQGPGGGKREREEENEKEGRGKERLEKDKVGGVVVEEKGPEQVKEL